MPGVMFQDVVSLRARSNRKWYTLPLSFLIHTSVLAVLVVVPLIATNALPKPREIMEFVTPYVPLIPTPPVLDRMPPTLRAGGATGTPVVAPSSIGPETGVIFQPGQIETTGLESLIGSLDVSQMTVDAPPPIAPELSPPISIGGSIKPPIRTKYVTPEYPALARSTKVEGVVIIEAIIGVDGRVEHARVMRPKPFLDEAALAAVREWEYTPTLLNGKPTRVIMTVTVNYRLNP